MSMLAPGAAAAMSAGVAGSGSKGGSKRGDVVFAEFRKQPFVLSYYMPYCEPGNVFVHGYMGQLYGSDGK